MSLVERIKDLLDQGDYLEADRLSNDLKVTAYQNLAEVPNIAASIKHHEDLLSSLEAKIKNYESELRNVKDTAFQMEEEEHAVQVQCKNLTDTCKIIEELLENLRIPDYIQVDLLRNNLNDQADVEQIVRALEEFEKILCYKTDSEINSLKCVIDQRDHADNIKEKFGQRFYCYFPEYVDFLINEFSESLINTIYSNPLTLPEHDIIHNRLVYLIPLVGWLRRHNISIYEAVRNFYLDRSKAQYDKEFEAFFGNARERMSNPVKNHGRPHELATELKKRNSAGAGGESGSTRASSLSGTGTGTLDTLDSASAKGSDISYTGWEEFDAYIEEILRAIDPCCIAEQQFYSEFFPSDAISVDDNPNSQHYRQLVIMFGGLNNELTKFVHYYNDQNGLYSLYLLVRLSQYLARHESEFFLMQIYREVRLTIKRNFDNFMEQQLNTIRELKPPKHSKCGVLSVVKSFDQFAKQVESLFKSIGARRSDIDRWYPELVSELFRMIDKMDHNKTPSEMIRLENYNYLHDVLRSIKVPCLEKQRKEANSQYKEALNSYVARYFGRPLEKLNIFFEGVQTKIAQGVKEEEISFQLAFSKQELRKVLNLVTLREVRKGLEEMYRRIEKHASEPDSNLIQVIWRAMQEEFLTQYKAIQGMIERCYPSSNLSLTFTIDDVLQVFSDIAQSH